MLRESAPEAELTNLIARQVDLGGYCLEADIGLPFMLVRCWVALGICPR